MRGAIYGYLPKHNLLDPVHREGEHRPIPARDRKKEKPRRGVRRG